MKNSKLIKDMKKLVDFIQAHDNTEGERYYVIAQDMLEYLKLHSKPSLDNDTRNKLIAKNKREWKQGTQHCYKCKEDIPNTEFYEHVKKYCKNIGMDNGTYCDSDELAKILKMKGARK